VRSRIGTRRLRRRKFGNPQGAYRHVASSHPTPMVVDLAQVVGEMGRQMQQEVASRDSHTCQLPGKDRLEIVRAKLRQGRLDGFDRSIYLLEQLASRHTRLPAEFEMPSGTFQRSLSRS